MRISCGLQESQSQEGINMWSHMTERSASPGGPWRMGGLGFGLPLSRLYARYFGACKERLLLSRHSCFISAHLQILLQNSFIRLSCKDAS